MCGDTFVTNVTEQKVTVMHDFFSSFFRAWHVLLKNYSFLEMYFLHQIEEKRKFWNQGFCNYMPQKVTLAFPLLHLYLGWQQQPVANKTQGIALICSLMTGHLSCAKCSVEHRNMVTVCISQHNVNKHGYTKWLLVTWCNLLILRGLC